MSEKLTKDVNFFIEQLREDGAIPPAGSNFVSEKGNPAHVVTTLYSIFTHSDGRKILEKILRRFPEVSDTLIDAVSGIGYEDDQAKREAINTIESMVRQTRRRRIN